MKDFYMLLVYCIFTPLPGVLILLLSLGLWIVAFVLVCRGDFKMMDDSDETTNISTFQNLYEACEHILVLKSDKKQKRNVYCWILWSTLLACFAYASCVHIVAHIVWFYSNCFTFFQSLLLLGVSGISVCTHMEAKVQHRYCGINTSWIGRCIHV